MNKSLAHLLEILDLEAIEVNIFRGKQSTDNWQRVFGGQVIAQALIAADRTVASDRRAHSLHAYFLRPGDPEVPILYEVDRIRDGRSFTTRRVVAIQHGKAIFSTSVSFQIEEEGPSHQCAMPAVPEPESLISEDELLKAESADMTKEMEAWLLRERPIEMRWVDPRDERSKEKLAPVQNVWMKTVGKLPNDPAIHLAALAYASDLTLLGTATRAHGLSWRQGTVQSTSLDHALWFHRPFRCDEWLLYSQDSPNSGFSRSFNHGRIFTRSGELIASVAQEGLMRVVDPAKLK